MRLLEQLYANVERLNDAIFDPATFGMLSAKEKLFAMSIHLKAIAALSVTIEEHKDVVNQVNIQVNQLIKNDNKMLQIPKESREKIRAAVTKMVANVLNQSSDTAMLDDGAKTDDERLQ